MGSNRRRSVRLRDRIPAVVATLLAIGILYLVVRTALAATNPLAAALPPAEHSGFLRLRLYEMLAPGRRVTPDVHALVQQTAVTEPLAFEPFFIASLAADQRGDLRQAISLMEEARRRRRSFMPTRLQLSSYYTRAGRLADGLHELEMALLLRQQALEPAMVELAKLVRVPEGRRLLADALARNPAWRPAFFTIARGQGVTPDQAYSLMQEVRARRPDADLRLERELFMSALVGDGQIARAREIWLGTLPREERAANLLMANPRFAGRAVDAPFGWSLQATDVGRAEIRDAGSPQPYLYADYFGGSNAVLAEQLLALQAGSYTLRFDVAGEGASGASRLTWTLACQAGSPELARAELASATAAFRPMQVRFTVPAGCAGQRLRLLAEAGDVPTTVTMRFRGLEIVR